MSTVKNIAAVLAASALLSISAGCRTTGTERAAKAAESLNVLQAEIGSANEKLGLSVAALNDLVKNPQSNLRPQYETFSKSLEALDAQIASVRSRAETMKARGKEYFTAWEETSKSLSSPEMQEYSQGRRAQLGASYESIQTEVARIGELGKPLMAALRDTQKVLSLDLTPSGLDLAKAPSEKANVDAAALKVEVEKLQKDLQDVAKLLAPDAKSK
jgi:hypothetical protein